MHCASHGCCDTLGRDGSRPSDCMCGTLPRVAVRFVHSSSPATSCVHRLTVACIGCLPARPTWLRSGDRKTFATFRSLDIKESSSYLHYLPVTTGTTGWLTGCLVCHGRLRLSPSSSRRSHHDCCSYIGERPLDLFSDSCKLKDTSETPHMMNSLTSSTRTKMRRSLCDSGRSIYYDTMLLWHGGHGYIPHYLQFMSANTNYTRKATSATTI